MSKHSEDGPKRLSDWGNSLLNKLAARTRRRRKGQASKRRRESERRCIDREMPDV